jgi:5-methylcytosine-specific restriction protein A
MVKIKTMAPAIRVIDTRTVKVAPKVADAELLSPEHRVWRAQVLRNAGYRCEATDQGQRCPKAAPTHRMFADHIRERRDGGAPFDPHNGQCLCGSHHTKKTAAARVRRLAQR